MASARAEQAKQMRKQGQTYSQIGLVLGVSAQRAYQLVNRETKPYMNQPSKTALRKVIENHKDKYCSFD